MKITEIKNALQDLIIRLQDAEKGYEEIEKATSIIPLKNWLTKYAKERHNMHQVLEQHVNNLGGNAKVKTSFLGDLHRMFIDIKINNTDFNNEFNAIVNEINRGASTLISDYQTVMTDVELPAEIVQTLLSQKTTLEIELEELNKLKAELNTVNA